MKVKAFITHKKAEKYSDCQDSFAVNGEIKAIAVSDGISQTIFSGIWSEILTNAFVEKPWCISTEIPFPKQCLSDYWYKRVEERKQAMCDNGNEMNLYMLERMLIESKTAGATFLGIQFIGQKWDGIVLGDTCLIEIKDGSVKEIHTSQKSETFDNMPDFYDSNATKNGRGVEKRISGELDPNTTLLLVSDPFSDFFSEHKDDATKFVKEMLDVSSHEEYETLVEIWRDEHHMHNDDSTVVIVEYDGKDVFDVVYKDDIKELRRAESQNTESNTTGVDVKPGPTTDALNQEGANGTLTETSTCRQEVPIKNVVKEILSKLKPKKLLKDILKGCNIIGELKGKISEVLGKYVIYKKQEDGTTKHS